MAHEVNQTTDAASEINPNGFITDRAIDGERRSIRRFNNGRVSARSTSVEPTTPTRTSTRASTRNSTGNSTGRNSRARSRIRSPTSHGQKPNEQSLLVLGPNRNPTVAEISTAMAKLSVDHPACSKANKLREKLKTGANPNAETRTLSIPTHSCRVSVASSSFSTRTRNSVHARIAEIENRIKRHICPPLESVKEVDWTE